MQTKEYELIHEDDETRVTKQEAIKYLERLKRFFQQHSQDYSLICQVEKNRQFSALMVEKFQLAMLTFKN